jgi:5'(3')-deoxyribonucleotidase
MYNITVTAPDGKGKIYEAQRYEAAIKYAKEQSESGAEVNIFRSTDNLLCWSSSDSAGLKAYMEYSSEQWLNLEKGRGAAADKPSVYFDIDGVLGYFYADARGLVYPDEVLDPKTHYFRTIAPHEFMVALAEKLTEQGLDVCVISAADNNTIRDKYEWLQEYCPFIKDENIFFCPLGADKSDFVKNNASISILIDDFSKNLEQWKGTPVKAINSINSIDNDKVCINAHLAEIDDSYWDSIMNSSIESITQLISAQDLEMNRRFGQSERTTNRSSERGQQ